MRRIRYPLLLVLLVGGWLSLAEPRCAFACSCAGPDSPRVERDRATAVFLGKVSAMVAPTGEIISTADPEQITFQVSQTWKGPSYTTLIVTTAREDISCGYPFELDREYLVYASGSAIDLRASLCSRTRAVKEAGEDIAVLGAGAVPRASLPPQLVPTTFIPQTPTSIADHVGKGAYPIGAYPGTITPAATGAIAPAAGVGLPIIVLGALGVALGVVLVRRYRPRNQ